MARDRKTERKQADPQKDWTPGEVVHELGPSHAGLNIRPRGVGGVEAYPKAEPGEAGPPGAKRRKR